MKQGLGDRLVAFLAAGSSIQARNETDEAAVRKVPQAFAEAWATRDGHQLAKPWPTM